MRTRKLVTAMWLGGLFVALSLLGACSTSQAAVAYRKPGAIAAERQQDENACLRSSTGPNDEGYILLPFDIDRAAYRRCMEARGYVAEPAAPRSARP